MLPASEFVIDRVKANRMPCQTKISLAARPCTQCVNHPATGGVPGCEVGSADRKQRDPSREIAMGYWRRVSRACQNGNYPVKRNRAHCERTINDLALAHMVTKMPRGSHSSRWSIRGPNAWRDCNFCTICVSGSREGERAFFAVSGLRPARTLG